MSVTVSVIIPVYNAENYIETTIENLKKQTWQEYEVFLVDNKSTDGSYQVMQQAIEGDGRFHILSEQKKGPAAARNKGLVEATGQWILFLDADDDFPSDMLEALLRPTLEEAACREASATEIVTDVGNGSQTEAGTDAIMLVVSGYQTYQKGQLLYESPPVNQTFTIEQMMSRLFQVEHYQGFVWNKLFRRDVITWGSLRFRENIFYNEDRLFVENYLGKCLAMVRSGDSNAKFPVAKMISARTYHYQLREDSTMAVSRENTSVTEQEVTEIAAFDCMLHDIYETVGADSETFSLAMQDMVMSELRLFRRMIGTKHIFQYRKHPMRSYARAARRMQVNFDDERDGIFWKVFLRYGRTGLTYTKDPGFFDKAQ